MVAAFIASPVKLIRGLAGESYDPTQVMSLQVSE